MDRHFGFLGFFGPGFVCSVGPGSYFGWSRFCLFSVVREGLGFFGSIFWKIFGSFVWILGFFARVSIGFFLQGLVI